MKVIQVVGYKNTGKTTLICRLAERFKADGWKVGAVKHDAHRFEMDHPGKDTWKFRESGVSAIAISSGERTAFLEEKPVPLAELLERMLHMDIVLVEGFKAEGYPKLVLLKSADQAALAGSLEGVIAAIVWDDAIIAGLDAAVPVYHIDDLEGIYSVLAK